MFLEKTWQFFASCMARVFKQIQHNDKKAKCSIYVLTRFYKSYRRKSLRCFAVLFRAQNKRAEF